MAGDTIRSWVLTRSTGQSCGSCRKRTRAVEARATGKHGPPDGCFTYSYIQHA